MSKYLQRLGVVGLVFLVLSLAGLATGLGFRLAGDLRTSTAVYQIGLVVSLTGLVLVVVRNSRRKRPK
jgi:hypothetical protein